MAATIIKEIEDKHELNLNRATREVDLSTIVFANGTVEHFSRLSSQARTDAASGDEFLPRLSSLLDVAVEDIRELLSWSSGPYLFAGRRKNESRSYMACCSLCRKRRSAKTDVEPINSPGDNETLDQAIDKIFKTLLDGMAPIKAELMEPWKGGEFESKLADLEKPCLGTMELTVQTLSGKEVKVHCDPKCTVKDLKEQLRTYGGPRVSDQKLLMGADDLANAQTLEELGVKNGAAITLLVCESCEVCGADGCRCRDCHGEGRYGETGCPMCGKQRAVCQICKGQCKCSACHGNPWGVCEVCGSRPPCWGGDTLALLADGGVKKVRECQIGDEVRTLRGSKKISRIWGRNVHLPQHVDTEVCCIDGVWITSHHPIISEGQWVFPVDTKASAPWHQRLHIVPDMFNFELEGHDDTILLWAGLSGKGLVVSCTIGKYLGPRFGYGICTRRSTRCAHECRQCDAVFVGGLEHNNIPSEMRWARFPEFPQVEWEDGISEFQLAAAVVNNFIPPVLPRLSASKFPKCREESLERVPLLTWVGVAA